MRKISEDVPGGALSTFRKFPNRLLGASLAGAVTLLPAGFPGTARAEAVADRTAAAAAPAAQFPPFRVLVSAFGPWRNHARNHSERVLRILASDPSLREHGIEITPITLPVIYDEAAEPVRQAFSRAPVRPDLVLSLGEGTCELRIETAATNLDQTPSLADNRGVVRNGNEIEPSGPKRIGFSYPAGVMYCAVSAGPDRLLVDMRSNEPDNEPGIDALPVPIRVSISPGAYVCNNTAYHLARSFAALDVPYGFIHVPAAGCAAGISRPERSEALIARMLRAAEARRHRGSERDREPASAVPVLLPVDAAGAEARLRQITVDPGAPACERDFAQRLRAAYPASPAEGLDPTLLSPALRHIRGARGVQKM